MAAAVVLVALLAIVPAAEAASRQKVFDRFTERRPNAVTGRTFGVDFFDPANPATGKPPVARHVRIVLHSGARFDTSAAPHYTATNTELQLNGPGICPGSQVGTNDVLIDTGFPDPFRWLRSQVVILNNANEVVLVSESPITVTTGDGEVTVPFFRTRSVFRGTVRDNVLEIPAGFIPGASTDGGSRKRERAFFPPRRSRVEGRWRNYLTTPPRCPRRGYWRNTITYTYADGVRETSASRTRCGRTRARSRRPRSRGRSRGAAVRRLEAEPARTPRG